MRILEQGKVFKKNNKNFLRTIRKIIVFIYKKKTNKTAVIRPLDTIKEVLKSQSLTTSHLEHEGGLSRLIFDNKGGDFIFMRSIEKW